MKTYIFFVLVGLLCLGCQTESSVPKAFVFQNKEHHPLNDGETSLQKKPFSIVVGFEGWEIQAADTGISVAYVATDSLSLKSLFYQATSEKQLVSNFKQYVVPVASSQNLRLWKPNKTTIERHTFGREKGKQFCHFSRCKESPALLRLILDIEEIDGIDIQHHPARHLILFIAVKSQSKMYYFKHVISFSVDES